LPFVDVSNVKGDFFGMQKVKNDLEYERVDETTFHAI